MLSPADPKTLFWARAAIYGGLWGAVEVTLGGFLHTLRVPLAGVFLAACEAGFLVAVRRITGAKGIALAVAAVAACVKSLAPAGALLSPLVGIVTEGLLVELAFLTLPGAWLPAVVGGAASTLWSLAQFILTQILFFGAGTLKVYELAYRGAQKMVGLPFTRAALLFPVVLLAFMGAGAGLWGLRLGGVAAKRLSPGGGP